MAIHQMGMEEKRSKTWNRTVYVNTWKRAQDNIIQRRPLSMQESLYSEAEKLAGKRDSKPWPP